MTINELLRMPMYNMVLAEVSLLHIYVNHINGLKATNRAKMLNENSNYFRQSSLSDSAGF